MEKNKIYIASALLVIIVLAGGLFYMASREKIKTGVQPQAVKPENYPITKPETDVITSVIITTDKALYSPQEEITAMIVINNEFATAKEWVLVADIIKQPSADTAAPLMRQQATVTLAADEEKRSDIKFPPSLAVLTPGKYTLEVNVLEDNQLISMKASNFAVK